MGIATKSTAISTQKIARCKEHELLLVGRVHESQQRKTFCIAKYWAAWGKDVGVVWVAYHGTVYFSNIFEFPFPHCCDFFFAGSNPHFPKSVSFPSRWSFSRYRRDEPRFHGKKYHSKAILKTLTWTFGLPPTIGPKVSADHPPWKRTFWPPEHWWVGKDDSFPVQNGPFFRGQTREFSGVVYPLNNKMETAPTFKPYGLPSCEVLFIRKEGGLFLVASHLGCVRYQSIPQTSKYLLRRCYVFGVQIPS